MSQRSGAVHAIGDLERHRATRIVLEESWSKHRGSMPTARRAGPRPVTARGPAGRTREPTRVSRERSRNDNARPSSPAPGCSSPAPVPRALLEAGQRSPSVLQGVVASARGGDTTLGRQRKEARSMTLVGVDLHTRDESGPEHGQGRLQKRRIRHEGDKVERFHRALATPRPWRSRAPATRSGFTP
jgi:hypothetical protein